MASPRVSVPLSEEVHGYLVTIAECTGRPLSGVLVDLIEGNKSALGGYARLLKVTKGFPKTAATAYAVGLRSALISVNQALARVYEENAPGRASLAPPPTDAAQAGGLMPLLDTIEKAEAEDRAERR